MKNERFGDGFLKEIRSAREDYGQDVSRWICVHFDRTVEISLFGDLCFARYYL